MTDEDEEFNRIEREAAMRQEAVAAAIAPPVRERNFCERCGKRLEKGFHIHTCTPPEKNS
jgi:hypothetical protein